MRLPLRADLEGKSYSRDRIGRLARPELILEQVPVLVKNLQRRRGDALPKSGKGRLHAIALVPDLGEGMDRRRLRLAGDVVNDLIAPAIARFDIDLVDYRRGTRRPLVLKRFFRIGALLCIGTDRNTIQ